MQTSYLSHAQLSSLNPMDIRELRSQFIKTSMQMHGSQLMALKRASKSPEYSRPYISGDPINLIDWKAYARTDSLIVREKRDEASSKVSIVWELSPSMDWPTGLELGKQKAIPSKFEIATRIALHLSHLHLRLGDQANLWLHHPMNSENNLVFSPRQPSDLLSLFNTILKNKFNTQTSLPFFAKRPFHIPKLDRLYWISDGLNDLTFTKLVKKAKRGCFMHLLSSLEEELEWLKDDCCYFDHTGEKNEFLGKNLKKGKSYYQELSSWKQQLKETVQGVGSQYIPLTERTALTTYYQFIDSLFENKK
ncbi:MAG: DUF58 domain-containing protein [Oligoflexales bacterium]|nr:DUF58 domain-containing protein [Oligoflexales bacterium]